MNKIYNLHGKMVEWTKGTALLSLCMMMFACSQDNEPLDESIALTTPVVELAEVKATVSRNAVAPTAMTLSVDLLNAEGAVIEGRNCTYTKADGNWGTPANPIIVTGGAGRYYARACASAVTVGEVTDAFYCYKGTVIVANDGKFTLDNPMTPLTAAIKVVLKDANGNSLTNSDYTITLFNLNKATAISWDSDSNSSLTISDLGSTGEVLSGTVGHFLTKNVTTSESWKLMTVTKDNITWTVNATGTLTLNPGQIHTLTITLGGNSVVTLGNEGISVGGFTESTDDDISIER